MCWRAMASSASAEVAQVPVISKSGSASSNRLRLSRKRLWSSTSRIRIVFIGGQQRSKFDDKARPVGLGLVAKIATKASHKSARQIEPETTGLGFPLKGPEQAIGLSYSAPRVLKPHGHAPRFHGVFNSQRPP